jgi:hypothetical protein
VRLIVTLAVLVPTAAAAAPVSKAWLGTFEPAERAPACSDCKGPHVVPRTGAVRVLPPGEGAAPEGEVVIASPLLGLVVRGKVDGGRIALPFFAYDERDSDNTVVLLPGDTVARFVAATAADLAAIKEALVREDALSVGRRDLALHALRDLEVGALDLDGDGKADLVATYGCTAWFDGNCQAHGQFFLVHRGAKWVEIE